MRKPSGAIAVLFSLFLMRLAYGLFCVFDAEDQKQIYLIGLKFYSTGLWPYFGPDVAQQVQIPGALQGIIVGVPLMVWPIPESPFLVVNLLSFGAICLFAWYCSEHLPRLPRWLIWGWLLTAPWTVDLSTNIHNVSYVLIGSIVFFTGFMETLPALRLGRIPTGLCNAMMGLALFWTVQVHLSAIILVPYVVVSFYFQFRERSSHIVPALLSFALGAAPMLALLIPTYMHYGLSKGSGETSRILSIHPTNLSESLSILARYFSLASFEVPRFIGRNTATRLEFLRAHVWAMPFVLVTLVLGIVQPIVMLFSGLKSEHPEKHWLAVKMLTFSSWVLVCVSFIFTTKAPAAHTYFVLLPIAMLYAFYVFQFWADRQWFRTLAKVLLFSNVVFHAAMAVHNAPERVMTRTTIREAIQQKDYRTYGERRPGTLY